MTTLFKTPTNLTLQLHSDDPVLPEQRRQDLTCDDPQQNETETPSMLPHRLEDQTEPQTIKENFKPSG